MSVCRLIKIAFKDLRGSRRSLTLYASGLFLGVSILIFALAVKDHVSSIIDYQALSSLGSDLSIRSKDPIPLEILNGLAIENSTKEVRFRSMLNFENGFTRLTQVRAIEKNYPFYGEVKTIPGNAWNLLSDQSVILDQSLLLSSQAKIGDSIKIGSSTFQIISGATQFPGLTPLNSAISPRVFISYEAALKTNMLSRDSIADYFLHIKAKPGFASEVENKLTSSLPNNYNLDTPKQIKDRLGRVSNNLNIYISLVGLACLALGAISAASATYFYLLGKIREAAIFKSLGLTGTQVAGIYLIQLLAISLISTFSASVFALTSYYLLMPELLKFFLIPYQLNFPLLSVLSGIALGISTMMIVTIPGILLLKKIPALSLLKNDYKIYLSKHALLSITFLSFLIAPITLLFFTSTKTALIYGIILNIIIILLWICSYICKKLALKTGKLKLPFVVKYSLLSLGRPGNLTTALINAFSFTMIIASTLIILQHAINQQISRVKSDRIANLFIYDLAPEDTNKVKDFLAQESVAISEEVPIVLMRIDKIKGKESSLILKDQNSKIPAWTLKRDYWNSYRSHILANEEIIDGDLIERYDPKIHGELIPISLDTSLANNLGLKIGDQIEFEAQGVNFLTKVNSLRKIHWEKMQRNAFVIFPLGVLEDAPKFIFLTAYVQDPQISSRIQRQLVQDFPGISVIDIRFIADSLLPILDSISLTSSLLAILIALTSAIVLLSAIVSGKDQRQAELNLLKVLGATKKQIKIISFLEFLLISIISGLIGIFVSLALSAILSNLSLNLEFSLPFSKLAKLFLAFMLLSMTLTIIRTADK